MRRILELMGVLAAAGVLFWFFPLFRVVSLQTRSASQTATLENAAEFAASFWDTQLAEALPDAADAATVLVTLRENPDEARKKFGRSVGLSRTSYFFIRGNGRIVSIDRKTVGVTLHTEGTDPDVLLVHGLVFGNAVRDAVGLLNPSNYPNSQYFNDISSELNRIVETRILPSLEEQAAVGRTLRFVGCAEIENRADGVMQLRTVPIEVRFE